MFIEFVATDFSTRRKCRRVTSLFRDIDDSTGNPCYNVDWRSQEPNIVRMYIAGGFPSQFPSFPYRKTDMHVNYMMQYYNLVWFQGSFVVGSDRPICAKCRLITHWSLESASNGEYTFEHACRDGNLGAAKYILRYRSEAQAVLVDQAFNCDVWNGAFDSGNLKLLKWLYVTCPCLSDLSPNCLRETIRNGYLDVAKWVWGLEDIELSYDDLYYTACAGGFIKIALWLFSDTDIDPTLSDRMFAAEAACFYGHHRLLMKVKDTLPWFQPSAGCLVSVFKGYMARVDLSPADAAIAVKAKYRVLIHFVLDCFHRGWFTENMMILAIRFDDIEVVQRMRELGCPWDKRCSAVAVMLPSLQILNWMRMQKPPCPWNRDTILKVLKRT